MYWTSAKPTREGYYWVKKEGGEPEIIKVESDKSTDALVFYEIGNETACDMDYSKDFFDLWLRIEYPE